MRRSANGRTGILACQAGIRACQADRNVRPTAARGFTLLELTIAFGILLTALLSVWVLLTNANRHQEQLWDELLASELATSALEQALAEKELAATPPEGKAVPFAPREGVTVPLPAIQVALHVTPVPERSDLLQLRAVVTWFARGRVQSLERTTRRTAR